MNFVKILTNFVLLLLLPKFYLYIFFYYKKGGACPFPACVCARRTAPPRHAHGMKPVFVKVGPIPVKVVPSVTAPPRERDRIPCYGSSS